MFKRALQIGRIRGVPLRLHYTLLLIVPYLAYELAHGARAIAAQADIPMTSSTAALFVWGLALSIAIFVSIFLHELAHVVVAQRAGGKVHAITLMLLGGVSEIEEMPPGNPEAVMAAVGPLTSIVLGIAGLGLFLLLGAASPLVRLFVYYLSVTNVVIGIFNLIPAFPLDGGRVLRALLRRRLGQVRATTVSAGVSKVMAIALVVYGLLARNFILALIAFFLFAAGDAEARETVIREALKGMRVGDLAAPDVPVLSMDDTVDSARLAFARTSAPAVALEDGEAKPSVLTLAELLRACRSGAAGPETRLRAVPVRSYPVVGEEEDVSRALEEMARARTDLAVVTRHGGRAGFVRREDIARAVEMSGLWRRGRAEAKH